MQYYYGGNRSISMPSNVANELVQISNTCHGEATLKARQCLSDLYSMTWPTNYPICDKYNVLTFATAPLFQTLKNDDITVSPNPAQSEITFHIPDHLRKSLMGIEIYDLTGRKRLSKSFPNGSDN